jgi:hypothetical protein
MPKFRKIGAPSNVEDLWIPFTRILGRKKYVNNNAYESNMQCSRLVSII